MPYPERYDERPVAQLVSNHFIEGRKNEKHGWSRPDTFVLAMAQKLVDDGWVFDGSSIKPNVRGTGTNGSCDDVTVSSRDNIVEGSLRLRTSRGDTGYNCSIRVIPVIQRIEEVEPAPITTAASAPNAGDELGRNSNRYGLLFVLFSGVTGLLLGGSAIWALLSQRGLLRAEAKPLGTRRRKGRKKNAGPEIAPNDV
jgi:hypothetical protein